MTQRIFKYTLELQGVQTIKIHKNAQFISVQNQGEQLVVHAIIDTAYPQMDYEFSIFGTGDVLPEKLGTHIGTTQLLDTFVWHVFVK